MLHTVGEVLDTDGLLDTIADTVQTTLAESGEVKNGFSERLTRDSSGGYCTAADRGSALDGDNTASELGSLDRGFLTSWTGADYGDIEVWHLGAVCPNLGGMPRAIRRAGLR